MIICELVGEVVVVVFVVLVDDCDGDDWDFDEGDLDFDCDVQEYQCQVEGDYEWLLVLWVEGFYFGVVVVDVGVLQVGWFFVILSCVCVIEVES